MPPPARPQFQCCFLQLRLVVKFEYRCEKNLLALMLSVLVIYTTTLKSGGGGESESDNFLLLSRCKDS